MNNTLKIWPPFALTNVIIDETGKIINPHEVKIINYEEEKKDKLETES